MKALKQLAVNSLQFLKGYEKQLLFDCFDDWQDLVKLQKSDLEYLIQRRLPTINWSVYQSYLDPLVLEHLRLDLDRSGIWIVQKGESSYPPLLSEIYDPPFILMVKGESWNYGASIAVVGTRYPSSVGETAARDLAKGLAEFGVTSISGLARGIDAAAHWGTVLGGGETVAVLGHGLSFMYPKSNSYLAAKICASGGSLVSEFNQNVGPQKHQFPKRNRIISGLSQGTVIVEAPERSGALITAEYALEQNREVWVHRCVLGTNSKGTLKLLEDGANSIGSAKN
jgi:DNA processing protein